MSQWTWAATLLQSSNVSWKYGVSGPFWYASGATIQILLFAILAIQVKIRAPHMHTYLEVIKIRWGTFSHVTFIVFGLMCNMIVTSMLLLGGSLIKGVGKPEPLVLERCRRWRQVERATISFARVRRCTPPRARWTGMSQRGIDQDYCPSPADAGCKDVRRFLREARAPT